MIGPLSTHMATGQATKFIIEKWYELSERFLISVIPGQKQLSYIPW
jgi:hypothetical protein